MVCYVKLDYYKALLKDSSKFGLFEVSLTLEFVEVAGPLQLSTLFQYWLVQLALNFYQKQTKR